MSGFNFEQIDNIISELFDTDFLDVRRDVGSELQEIYSNIPCHIAFNSADNPDPTSVDTKPIIQSVNIHTPNWVDIRNNDFLVAKRMDNKGNILIVYSGRCGNPVVSQGRKKVVMSMNATDSEIPTPTPPKNPILITINYLYNDVQIQDSIIQEVEKNSSFTIIAPIIEGYSPKYCIIDGEVQSITTAYILDVGVENHTIEFIYDVSYEPNILRILVDGLYTKDDGSLANGYHFYKKINIDNVVKDNGGYQITCDDVDWIHEDNGKNISISVGTKIILIPGNIFVKVSEIVSVDNGKVTFNAEQFIPNESELNAYITGWYD